MLANVGPELGNIGTNAFERRDAWAGAREGLGAYIKPWISLSALFAARPYVLIQRGHISWEVSGSKVLKRRGTIAKIRALRSNEKQRERKEKERTSSVCHESAFQTHHTARCPRLGWKCGHLPARRIDEELMPAATQPPGDCAEAASYWHLWFFS